MLSTPLWKNLKQEKGQPQYEQQQQQFAAVSELTSANDLSANPLLDSLGNNDNASNNGSNNSNSNNNNNNNDNNNNNYKLKRNETISSSRLDQLIDNIKFHYDGYQRRIRLFSSAVTTPESNVLVSKEVGELVPCGRSNLASASSLQTNSSQKGKRTSMSTSVLSPTSLSEVIAASVEPIALKSKPWTYWEERELYIAAEDLCCYLNGDINYRLLCSQLITLLSPLLAMWKAEVQLAKEFDTNTSLSKEHSISSEINTLWPTLQSLLRESVMLLEQQGISIPNSLTQLIRKCNEPDVLTVLSSTESASLLHQQSSSRQLEMTDDKDELEGNIDREDVRVKRCPSPEAPLLSMKQARKTTNPYNWRRNPPNEEEKNMVTNTKTEISSWQANQQLCASTSLTSNDRRTPQQQLTSTSEEEKNCYYFSSHNKEELNVEGKISVSPFIDDSTTTTTTPSSHNNRNHNLNCSGDSNNFFCSNKLDTVFGVAVSSPKSSIAESVPSNRSSLQASPATETINETFHVYNNYNDNKSDVHVASHNTKTNIDSSCGVELQQLQQQQQEQQEATLFVKSLAHVTTSTSHPVCANVNKTRCESEPAYLSRVNALQTGKHTNKNAVTNNVYNDNNSNYCNEQKEQKHIMSWVTKKSALRRMKLLELYREGGYAESGGKELLLDVLRVIFATEFDEPEYINNSKCAFVSFKKCVQGTINTMLSNYSVFMKHVCGATPLNSVYLTECLAQHVKPNMKLYDVLKTIQYPRETTELTLSHFNLGMRGLEPLLPLLPHLYRLVSIDVSYNDLNDDAVSELCELLQYHISLQTLNIAFNPITNKSMPTLLSLVRMLPRLFTVDVSGTAITHDKLINLTEYLQHNKQGVKVSLTETTSMWEREASVSSNTNNEKSYQREQ